MSSQFTLGTKANDAGHKDRRHLAPRFKRALPQATRQLRSNETGENGPGADGATPIWRKPLLTEQAGFVCSCLV